MPLRLKLTILFLVICIIPSLFISILTFTDYENSLEANRISALQDIIAFKADKIELIFATLKDNMEMAQYFWNVKKNLPILTRLAHNTNDPEFVAAKETLDGQLQPMQKILDLDNIMLLNPEGKIVYSSNASYAQKDFLNPLSDPRQKAFQEGKGKIYITDIYASKVRKEEPENMLISAPALDSKGAFIGVIVFDVNMVPIYKLIQGKTGLGNTGETIVVKKTGNEVIYLNPLRFDPEAALKRKIAIGAPVGLASQEAAQGIEGSGLSIDYRGKKVIAAWRYMPSLDWGIVGKVDVREAFADVDNLRNLVLIIFLIVFVLVSVMAFSISNAISNPISELTKGAKMIGSGNLEYKIESKTKDEIGQLSIAFNQMEHQLKKSEDKMITAAHYSRSLLEASLDPLITISKEGKVTDANEAAIKIRGIAREKLIGTDFSDYFTEPEKAEEGYRQAFTKGFVSDYPLTIRSKDGKLTNVLYNASVYKDDKGNILGVFAAARDITELIYLQDKLVRSEKLAIVGKLSASVAHELRNPLGVMKNVVYYLNMLELYKDNPEFKENLDIIAKEIERSDKIIADLLDFARAKKPVLFPENINLIVKEILSRIKADPGTEIALELDEDLPQIEVDALQMHQVFYNITKNALEAMEKGGVLKIRTTVNNSFMEISFSDTGGGIAKENLTKVFEPLFSTKTKGTGLGLAVCWSLVEGHNGKIEIESEPGKGSTFTVKLPIKKV